jgi:hypothetical protein
MGFDWVIKFIEIEGSDFGETDSDKKEIRIYYKNRSQQNIIETLIHELGHVIMFELANSVFHYEVEKLYDKEENLMRLTSPRVLSLLRDNHKLLNFIVKKIKELDSE